MREYTFPYLHFSISQRYRLNHQEISLIQRNRNFITYCVTYKKCAFRFETLPSFFFRYQNQLFRNKFKTYHNFFTRRNYLPICRRNISSRRGTLRHGWLLHSSFDPPRYFPPLLSLATMPSNDISQSLSHLHHKRCSFSPQSSHNFSLLRHTCPIVSFPPSASLKRVICQFGKVLEAKHSRPIAQHATILAIAPFFRFLR